MGLKQLSDEENNLKITPFKPEVLYRGVLVDVYDYNEEKEK